MVTAVDRWRPSQTAAWGTAGARAERDERGPSPRPWRQLDYRATGMLREDLPRRQPTEASPRPARCEDEVQSLAGPRGGLRILLDLSALSPSL
jgi:hypothetical protein